MFSVIASPDILANTSSELSKLEKSFISNLISKLVSISTRPSLIIGSFNKLPVCESKSSNICVFETCSDNNAPSVPITKSSATAFIVIGMIACCVIRSPERASSSLFDTPTVWTEILRLVKPLKFAIGLILTCDKLFRSSPASVMLLPSDINSELLGNKI